MVLTFENYDKIAISVFEKDGKLYATIGEISKFGNVNTVLNGEIEALPIMQEKHVIHFKWKTKIPKCPTCSKTENVIKYGTVMRRGKDTQCWHCKTCRKTW